MKSLTCCTAPAAALLLALAGAASASGTSSQSCYRAAGAAVPAPVSHTIVAVDTTTPGDAAAVASFRAAVMAMAAMPGERVSVLTFAGLAPGQALKTVADITNEPDPSDALVESLSVATGKKLRACVKRMRAANTAALAQTLAHEIAPADRVTGDFSEIVWSLRWVGLHYPGVDRWLVFSDGYEHSREKVFARSFYAKGAPRPINAEREIALVGKAGLSQRLSHPPRSVQWFGLGARAKSQAAPVEYVPPSEQDTLRAFWIAVLGQWGAANVRAGLVLPDEPGRDDISRGGISNGGS